MATLTPSRIARRLAGDFWPDVQAQRKLAPGVFDFSCAGHGGIVAVLDAAELPAELVDLARKHGKTELVGDYHGKLITSERYTRDTFDRMQAAGMAVLECWIGEEDCDFALIALASEKVCAGLAKTAREGSPYSTPEGMRAYCRENAERWNPEFVADMDSLEAARIVRVYDNGGRSFDRYTAIFAEQSSGAAGRPPVMDALGVGETGNVPNGFCMTVDAVEGPHLGARVQLADIAEPARRAIVAHWREWYADQGEEAEALALA